VSLIGGAAGGVDRFGKVVVPGLWALSFLGWLTELVLEWVHVEAFSGDLPNQSLNGK
jgi:hypothetical protein